MSAFISSEPVPVHLEGDTENIIYIKPKLDYATLTKVRSAVVGAKGAGANMEIGFDLAAANLALLVNNIVRWSGPDFGAMPCNAENIGRIDPNYPLLEKVLEEINERNPQDTKSPNSSSASGKNGSMPTTAQTKRAAASQTSLQ